MLRDLENLLQLLIERAGTRANCLWGNHFGTKGLNVAIIDLGVKREKKDLGRLAEKQGVGISRFEG